MIYAENINLLLSHEHSTDMDLDSMMPVNKIYHFWYEAITLVQSHF